MHTVDMRKSVGKKSIIRRLSRDKIIREKAELKQQKKELKKQKKLAKKRKNELIKQKKKEIKMLAKIDPQVLEEERAARSQEKWNQSNKLQDNPLLKSKRVESSLKRRWSLSMLKSSFRRTS